MDGDAIVTEFQTFDGITIVASTIRTGDESWVAFSVTAEEEGGEEAAAIAARVEGWEFRIADYKANLLTRRWEDILKAEAPEE